MAGPITVSSIQLDILPELQTWIGLEYKDLETQFDKIFTVLSSDRAEENFAKMTGMGLPTAFGELESVTFDDFKQFWRKTITHTKYGQGVIISMEALEDLKSGLVMRMEAKGLARGMGRVKELIAANYIDNSTIVSNGGDLVPLLSVSHPRIDGGVVSNRLSTDADLSETSIEDMVRETMDICDDRGFRLNVSPQKLLVSRANYAEAPRILQTTGQVYTPDNTINAIQVLGLLPQGYMVNRYLEDLDAFYMLTDAVAAEDGLVHYIKKPLTIGSDNVFDNDAAKFKAVSKFSFAHKDPLCIVGTPGA